MKKHAFVYNRKRHGVFQFGTRQHDFRVKPRFPRKLSPEFLFADALNNLSELAEGSDDVLQRPRPQALTLDATPVRQALVCYGTVGTRKRVPGWIDV